MKYLLLLICMVCVTSLSQAKKIAELRESLQYPILSDIEENVFYIYEAKSTNIYQYKIYPGKKYDALKIGGGKGEGPFEFKWIHHVKAYPGYIFVSSGGKISYFYKNGREKKEKKIPYATTSYFPVGNHFVCKKYDTEFKKRTLTIKLLAPDLEEKKDLMSAEFANRYESANQKKNLVVIRDFFDYKIEKDRIYIGNTQKGFHFSIFDEKGEKLYEIDRPYKKIPVMPKHKQEEMDLLLETVGKARFERAVKKYNYLYPEFFPAYSNFTVSEGEIYVLTYPKLKGKQQMLILSRKGNLIKKVKGVPTGQYNELFCIYKGKYYYLKDNEETEKWEIHAIAVNDREKCD